MTKSVKRKAHDAAKVRVPKATLDTLPRVPLAPPYNPVLVDRLDVTFPTNVIALMPAYESIPEEYKHHNGTYGDLFGSWFFLGLTKFEPVLRDPTMDINACLGHIACVKSSYEPSHQHKEATVRFLLDTWFSSIVWESKKEKLLSRLR